MKTKYIILFIALILGAFVHTKADPSTGQPAKIVDKPSKNKIAPAFQNITLTKEQGDRIVAIQNEFISRYEATPKAQRKDALLKLTRETNDNIREVLSPEQQVQYDKNLEDYRIHQETASKAKSPQPKQ